MCMCAKLIFLGFNNSVQVLSCLSQKRNDHMDDVNWPPQYWKHKTTIQRSNEMWLSNVQMKCDYWTLKRSLFDCNTLEIWCCAWTFMFETLYNLLYLLKIGCNLNRFRLNVHTSKFFWGEQVTLYRNYGLMMSNSVLWLKVFKLRSNVRIIILKAETTREEEGPYWPRAWIRFNPMEGH